MEQWVNRSVENRVEGEPEPLLPTFCARPGKWGMAAPSCLKKRDEEEKDERRKEEP